MAKTEKELADKHIVIKPSTIKHLKIQMAESNKI
jgi:hypothetical protein